MFSNRVEVNSIQLICKNSQAIIIYPMEQLHCQMKNLQYWRSAVYLAFIQQSRDSWDALRNVTSTKTLKVKTSYAVCTDHNNMKTLLECEWQQLKNNGVYKKFIRIPYYEITQKDLGRTENQGLVNNFCFTLLKMQ